MFSPTPQWTDMRRRVGSAPRIAEVKSNASAIRTTAATARSVAVTLASPYAPPWASTCRWHSLAKRLSTPPGASVSYRILPLQAARAAATTTPELSSQNMAE
jgi:hypothetical protein